MDFCYLCCLSLSWYIRKQLPIKSGLRADPVEIIISSFQSPVSRLTLSLQAGIVISKGKNGEVLFCYKYFAGKWIARKLIGQLLQCPISCIHISPWKSQISLCVFAILSELACRGARARPPGFAFQIRAKRYRIQDYSNHTVTYSNLQ